MYKYIQLRVGLQSRLKLFIVVVNIVYWRRGRMLVVANVVNVIEKFPTSRNEFIVVLLIGDVVFEMDKCASLRVFADTRSCFKPLQLIYNGDVEANYLCIVAIGTLVTQLLCVRLLRRLTASHS